MSTLIEILSPGFLLRDALLASLIIGVTCPLVGVYFVLRRMVFLGVALPQVSAAGIAFSFFLYGLTAGPHVTSQPDERAIAMVGAFSITLVATLFLALFERRGGMVEARIGTTYALAAAATILFLSKDPHGEAQLVHLLRGDMLAVTESSLTLLAVSLGGVVLALVAFRRELLLVSFDRDLAIVFGKRAGWWDLLLYLLIGIVISVGVMTAGPMATFGFLVVPPVTMRLVARRMLGFLLGSVVLGAGAALAGFYCAYRYDVPLGPAEVGLSCVLLGVVAAARTALRAVRGWRPS